LRQRLGSAPGRFAHRGLIDAQLSGGGGSGTLPSEGSIDAGATPRVIEGDTFVYAGERIRIADIDAGASRRLP
jgi:endonuclease YncB( thermonuclease family)